MRTCALSGVRIARHNLFPLHPAPARARAFTSPILPPSRPMISIRLPDGSQRQYPAALTVDEVARSIGAGLARAALAARVNGRLVDMSCLLDTDSEVAILTARDPEGLEVLRHSTAHLLAYAVKELFPQAQVTIGPVVEHGFYYDFSYQRPFTPEDLEAIEKRMREIAARDEVVVREEWARDDAVAFFRDQGEHYKAEIIASIPADQGISLYREGGFVDLCRGPHVPSTGRLKVFKLMKLAGAYWRGDSRNEMLQRIYGTAWGSQAEQDDYLHMLAEAERRDHRRLGRELDLFHLQDDAPGMVFWHPRGFAVWQQVEQYMRAVYRDNGYQEIRCPQVLDRSLWERSGHWENYKEAMFTTSSENRDYAVKPMNCPGHVQVYNAALRSYRDLPLRYGEFGACHRNEPSGALHGIMRVRGFVQDDGHIFCTEDQIQPECERYTALLQRVYADFGFDQIIYRVATRPARRVGSDALWDKAEAALMDTLRTSGVEFTVSAGDGAFYGPKIEYSLKDALGRLWQCGTMQVDFNMPERLGAEYVDLDNMRKHPVMLHRAIVGSMERFIGILIENHAGAMPAWLAPVQVSVLSITQHQAAYAAHLVQCLQKQGFRVESDLRNEKINYKIREHSLQKIPYLLIVGEKEARAEQVSVRMRGGTDLGAMSIESFARQLTLEVESKRSLPLPKAA